MERFKLAEDLQEQVFTIRPNFYLRKDIFMARTCKDAIDILKDAMAADASYAWSWHCNIAVCMTDQGIDFDKANAGARNFMKLAFGVDTQEPVSKSSDDSPQQPPVNFREFI